jgi:GntR family transcriptional repressor for pyruvate dehydrogenase complex
LEAVPSAHPSADPEDAAWPAFRHLGRRKAYEEVGEAIRAHILAGRLTVAQRLPTERDLAARFGVSRVVVREAIRSLELRGLLAVRKGPRGGIFVARDYDRPITESISNLLAMGEATLKDLFEVRKLIEPYAAACVARTGTEADLAVLADLVAEAESRHRLGASIRELNIELHRQIIVMSRNPVLATVGKTVLTLLSSRLEPIADHTPSDVALAMHKKLLSAFRTRNADRARSIMAQDIESVGESFDRVQVSGPAGASQPGAARSR